MLARFRSHFRQQLVGYIALFVALGGTGAYAAATIGAGNIKNDAVRSRHILDRQVGNADLQNASVGTGKIIDGHIQPVDLSPELKTRKLEYQRGNADKTKRTVLTLGNLQLSAECGSAPEHTAMTMYIKNIGSQAGEVNGTFIHGRSQGPSSTSTFGAQLDPGAETDLEPDPSTNATVWFHTASGRGPKEKAEGQLILRTPGRVTTVTFHAQVTYIDNPGVGFDRMECNWDGTAVSATS